MRILNINLHFYPQSIGGATVVAEKLAWGLIQAGHEVTNAYLSQAAGEEAFQVTDTPFGRSIGVMNIAQSPGNRFSSPAAASSLREIIDLIEPERIFIHAPQHTGIFEILSDPAIRSRSCIVAHDFFWVCLQGFRTLPDGERCHLAPGARACNRCAWYPGLTDTIYAQTHEILENCRAVVLPSQFLYDDYTAIIGRAPDNFVVQANPDRAETIIGDTSVLPIAAGAEQKQAGKTVFGFVGGPGESKGWNLVQAFMRRAEETAEDPDGVHVVLYDIGRHAKSPWYPLAGKGGVTVADPFHWSYGAHALAPIDVMLMPSFVRESFGLAARETLSLGGKAIIRSSGALAELVDKRGTVVADPDDDVDSLLAKLAQSEGSAREYWHGTSVKDYTARLMSL